jgi:hypothetical protein
VEVHSEQQVAIDEGMRRWYQNCRCCFGEAYPELKKQLDAERKAAQQQPAATGICEQAETMG